MTQPNERGELRPALSWKDALLRINELEAENKRLEEENNRLRTSYQKSEGEAQRLFKLYEAAREVAASLYEWRFQRDPDLMNEWDGITKFGDEVDKEITSRLKEARKDD